MPSLSLTTDFQGGTGCPEASLRAIAAAGFSHVHWCHQWNSDFLYGRHEVRQIAAWLREMGLQLLDLHGSSGWEKCWWSPREYERLAGVELVRNRLAMTAELGGRCVVMHAPKLPDSADDSPECQQCCRSIDDLLPAVRSLGVPLAIENMGGESFGFLRRLLAAYGPDELGLCYDSGHGNLGDRLGLQRLYPLRNRLLAVHLHDNDGSGDQHMIPFCGTVDWGQFTAIMADSSYDGVISLECNVTATPDAERPAFASAAYAAAMRLHEMCAGAKQARQL